MKDGKYDSLRNDKVRTVYLPYAQEEGPGVISFSVRTATTPESAMPQIRKVVSQLDPTVALWDFKTMDSQVQESLFAERMVAILCASFGALATILASIGLYGVTAYSVARRTREIGIRIALGAARQSVLRLVLSEVIILGVAGVCIGLPAALALSKYIRAQLYGVSPNDPITLAASAIVLLAVSFIAGMIPARRAAAVDPMVALRYE